MYRRRSAFTLIELLVVIAIIAILAVVVLVTLNPAELLRQSRDSNRLSDLATLNSAINIYNEDQGGGAGYSLGSPSITYLSISDPAASTTARTNCVGVGGTIATNTPYFNCPASSTARNVNGQGWIPINFTTMSAGSPIGSLPVDPTNSTSSNLYYTYQTNGSTYRLNAIPESQKYQASLGQSPLSFTAGSNTTLDGGAWVPVPGNATFGTQNFSVMKYDASCSDGKGNPAPPGNSADTTSYDIYNDSGTGGTPCTSPLSVAALPNAYPIAGIAETTAKLRCQSIGAHLLTNDEYMTIVTNAVGQGVNWSTGTVGSGKVPRGNSNSSQALAASSDDTQGYYGIAVGYQNDTIHKRTYTLSNGSVIWDMAGNVYQEVQRSVMNQGDLTTTINTPACSNSASSWNWCEYGNAGSTNVTSWTTDVTQAQTAPSNASWYSSQGTGQLQTWGPGGTSQNTTSFLRSGIWNFGANDGPFALSLDWTAYNTYYSVGFRCAR